MHIWNTYTAALIMAIGLIVTTPAFAVNFSCAIDLNGNGIFTEAGETATCASTPTGELCPIDAVNCTTTTTSTCPLGSTYPCTSGSCSQPVSCVDTSTPETCPLGSTYPCTSGSCSQPTACGVINILGITIATCPLDGSIYGSVSACSASCNTVAACVPAVPSFTCPATGLSFPDSASCNSTCANTATCSVTTSPPVCPLGSYACQDNTGTFQCSATSCIDLDATPPVVTTINDGVYTDDGARDATTGACLDQIMIFAGRNMECRTAGVDTAFQTCCKDFDMVVADSTGAAAEIGALVYAVNGAYEVAAAAYTAYATTGSAAAATTAAGNTAVVAFDPTTLAISIAIAVAIDYFVNNCNEKDMETGIQRASGQCYETGTGYCKRRWTGFGCVQRARTFCCFNSKLARIIHEQGRSQLKSFNTVAPDDCRGFSAEEFQYLDFSQIDLSSYYGDLKTSSATVTQSNMATDVNNFYTNIQP